MVQQRDKKKRQNWSALRVQQHATSNDIWELAAQPAAPDQVQRVMECKYTKCVAPGGAEHNNKEHVRCPCSIGLQRSSTLNELVRAYLIRLLRHTTEQPFPGHDSTVVQQAATRAEEAVRICRRSVIT